MIVLYKFFLSISSHLMFSFYLRLFFFLILYEFLIFIDFILINLRQIILVYFLNIDIIVQNIFFLHILTLFLKIFIFDTFLAVSFVSIQWLVVFYIFRNPLIHNNAHLTLLFTLKFRIWSQIFFGKNLSIHQFLFKIIFNFFFTITAQQQILLLSLIIFLQIIIMIPFTWKLTEIINNFLAVTQIVIQFQLLASNFLIFLSIVLVFNPQNEIGCGLFSSALMRLQMLFVFMVSTNTILY